MKKISVSFAGSGGGMGGGMGGGGGMSSSNIAGIVQGATGIGQMIAGSVKMGKAKRLMPQEVDPAQVSIIDNLKRIRLGYGTGSEAASYNKQINTGLSSANNAAVSNAGGNGGALMAVLGNAQTGAQNAYGQVAASLEKNRMGALTLENQAINDVAQRKLDIKMAKYLQAMGDATSLTKAGAQNFGASFNTFSGGTTSGDMTGGSGSTSGATDAASTVAGGVTTNGASGGFKKKKGDGSAISAASSGASSVQ